MALTHHFPMAGQPFVGLRPFDVDDRSLFFGRSVDTRRVLNLIDCTRLHVIYAPSGFGKTSLLRAGVLPLVSQHGQHEPIYLGSWAEEPLDVIQAALGGSLRRGRENLLMRLLCQRAVESSKRPLLILDQVEELARMPRAAEALWHSLASIAKAGPFLARFVVSVREDFLGMLTPLFDQVPGLMDTSYRLERLTRVDAREAITGPIDRYNALRGRRARAIHIEDGLVDDVLNQVLADSFSLAPVDRDSPSAYCASEPSEGQIEMPLLQVVMSRIWEREFEEGSSVLRCSTLKDLGQAKAIVDKHLKEVLNQMPSDDQEIAAQMLRFLITPSGTKIAHVASDLADYTDTSAANVTKVLEKLSGGNARILRPIAPSHPDGEPRYELLHDILAPGLQAWVSFHVRRKELGEQDKETLAFAMHSVVHEMKVPLQAMEKDLQRLRLETQHPIQRGREALLQRMETMCKNLRISITKYHTIASWASNETMSQAPVRGSLEKLVEAVVDMFRVPAEKKRVRIVVRKQEPLPLIQMQSDLMQVALANVVDNAVKYSGADGVVLVEYDREPSSVAVKIRNCGVCLSRDEVERVFERGVRGRQSSVGRSGMGLGLYIAREIVKRHEGTIDLAVQGSDGRRVRDHTSCVTTVTIRVPYGGSGWTS